MKISALLLLGLALLLSAYGMSTGGKAYECISFTLALLSSLAFAYLIAFYESQAKGVKYATLVRIMSRGYALYIIITSCCF